MHSKLGVLRWTLLMHGWLAAEGAFAQPREELNTLLSRKTFTYSGQSFSTEPLRKTYAQRDFSPIWVKNRQINAEGQALLSEITNSYRDGLEPAEYLSNLRGFSKVDSDEEAAKLDLALSRAFLTLGQDLFSGVTTPSATDPNIIIKRKKIDATQWLSGAANTGVSAMFAALRPNHPQYAQLRQMLSGYRMLKIRGGWKPIKAGKTIKPGMSSPRVIQLRANLVARGYDGLNAADPVVYDDGAVDAVKHFQTRHGLEPDGVVGAQTLAAMNVSAEDRVKQLSINLERWRWLPRQLGRTHVLVNQAGFELFVVKGRKTVGHHRVIVGKPYHQSPMFSGKIAYAEFNPTWTVPNSIAGNEMLPKIRKDPGYLSRNDYKLYSGWGRSSKPVDPYSISWGGVSAKRFPYRIVQQPGKKNALGRVKFIFPNKFNVYLHDTPNRNLFSKYARAFSHGCIRVEKPLDFAATLYRLQGGMKPGKIPEIIDKKERTRIRFKRQIPIHLSYFTAWVNDDGIPMFFNDVYQRDKLVGKYLF